MSGASTKWASGVGEVRRVSGVDKRQVAVPGPSWSVAFSTADKGTRRRAWEASSLITHNSHIWIIVSSPKCYTMYNIHVYTCIIYMVGKLRISSIRW